MTSPEFNCPACGILRGKGVPVFCSQLWRCEDFSDRLRLHRPWMDALTAVERALATGQAGEADMLAASQILTLIKPMLGKGRFSNGQKGKAVDR